MLLFAVILLIKCTETKYFKDKISHLLELDMASTSNYFSNIFGSW